MSTRASLGHAVSTGVGQYDRRPATTLNKTSIKPAVYGERFVKRRGLFSLTVASRHGVVSGCVSRQDNDRSAVHQLDQDRSGRRAGRGDAGVGAGLVDFGSLRRRSRRRRRRAADAARRSVAAGAPGHGGSVCAQPEAPAAIVQALSLDQPSVALPVLEHSPLLIDADLVDIVATGNGEMQCAIARRINLPPSVCAAIAEVGSAAAALELIENAYAELAPFSWDRIVERHGHLAAIRESMLVLEDLPAATRARAGRQALRTLAQFVVARNWLSADRAGRIASEARERSTVNIAARSRGEDMRGLVRHLRATGQLTAGLILRALLSGNLELFDAALAELSGLPQARVSALLHDRGGASLQALLIRAGLAEIDLRRVPRGARGQP